MPYIRIERLHEPFIYFYGRPATSVADLMVWSGTEDGMQVYTRVSRHGVGCYSTGEVGAHSHLRDRVSHCRSC